MADPGWAIQQTVFTELTAAGLTVYDGAAPEGSAYPYVTIGDDLADAEGSKDQDGWSFAVSLQCWSEDRGQKEVKLMAGTIRDRINRQQFTQDSYRIFQIRESSLRYLVEEDGHGRRAVIEYQIRAAPVI